MRKNAEKKSISKVLSGFRAALISIFAISGVVNILALTGALYMLQIYDRVLTSQSTPTLVLLSVLAICLYSFQGILAPPVARAPARPSILPPGQRVVPKRAMTI